MKCKCGSERIIVVEAKCSDMCLVKYGDNKRLGYVPGCLGIGKGDYIELIVCLDCGKLQSVDFPVAEETVLCKFSEEP
jgi:hypothetical protein